MAVIDYLNFDLLIERTSDVYVARVTQSPAGEASARFQLPFAEMELENFLLRIGRPRRGVRRLNSPEMDSASAFGKRLFEAVFGNEILGCFRSSLARAEEKDIGLRIRLRLNAPELTDLPWEYLCNPTLDRFLVLAVETPIVRYIEMPEGIRPLAVKPPLRILVMIASPNDHPTLDVEQEWEKLNQALLPLQRRGLVALERLEQATLSHLQRHLRRGKYHVFHFVGHGAFDEHARDGVLPLEDEMRRGRRVSGHYLGRLLHNHRPLRLAVLNACEGGRTSRTDPFTGTAQSLVQQGLPAVIAMQFEITDAAAITFAHEFYSALADGYPVDAAVVEARIAIASAENDVEWGTPVLYMRAPDGRVFDIELAKITQPPPAPSQELEAMSAPRPSPKTVPAQSPPTPKPAAAPSPTSPKSTTFWRNPWLLSLAAVTLVLAALAIFKNLDFQGPQIEEPAPNTTKENESEKLYAQFRNTGDAHFRQGEYAKAKSQYELARSYKSGDGYVIERIQECDDKLLAMQNQLQNPNRPVVYVSWEDANAYARWADKKLPTEAQWEYAARGDFTGLDGKPHYKYPWGDEASATRANFDGDGTRQGHDWKEAKRFLKDVGSYAANGYGLYDMAGNVWEWCADRYDANYYRVSPSRNPGGPSGVGPRVLRGGSWSYNAYNIWRINSIKNRPATIRLPVFALPTSFS